MNLLALLLLLIVHADTSDPSSIPDIVLPPQLDASTLEALDQAIDDRDAPDGAFIALLDHVENWPEGARSIGLRLVIDHDDLVESPESYRGELLVIEGRLEQHQTLGRPFEHVQEWYVRQADGRPVMVYVPVTPGPFPQDGDSVVIEAYFYKRLTLTDRNDTEQTYPVFVGVQPRIVHRSPVVPVPAAGNSTQWIPWIPVFLLMVGLLVVFILLIMFGVKQSKQASPRTGIVGDVDETPPDPPLPDDPAQAMGELKRRNSEDE